MGGVVGVGGDVGDAFGGVFLADQVAMGIVGEGVAAALVLPSAEPADAERAVVIGQADVLGRIGNLHPLG